MRSRFHTSSPAAPGLGFTVLSGLFLEQPAHGR